MQDTCIKKFRSILKGRTPVVALTVAGLIAVGGITYTHESNQREGLEEWAKKENITIVEMERMVIPRHFHITPKHTSVFRGVVKRADGTRQKAEVRVLPSLYTRLWNKDRIIVDWEEEVPDYLSKADYDAIPRPVKRAPLVFGPDKDSALRELARRERDRSGR